MQSDIAIWRSTLGLGSAGQSSPPQAELDGAAGQGKVIHYPATIALDGLDGVDGFALLPPSVSGDAGRSVSSAGDINGDGFDDMILGAPYDCVPHTAGASYVVFGHAGGFDASLRLDQLDGTNGFVIEGAAGNEASGWSVSSAGDVNGDGYDDVVIGARIADHETGAAYVVFGKADGFGASFSLADLDGTNGFRMAGVDQDDWTGSAVSSAGDVNGDGYDDLVVGASGASVHGTDSGSSFVVFGKAGGFDADLDLSTLDGANGFRINGFGSVAFSGWSVSSAGDINADGYDDVLIGAPNANGGAPLKGGAYVIFGKASGFSATVEVSDLDGSNGFNIVGAGGQAGMSVAAAGDLNGDGRSDLVIGAYNIGGSSFPHNGTAYVVFGQAGGFDDTIDVTKLHGSSGCRIDGVGNVEMGWSVASAGDVNGDGYGDLILGTGNFGTAAAFVIFGKAGGFGDSINVAGLDGTNGFTILKDSHLGGFSAGRAVSAAGDINGDGLADLIVGGVADSSSREAETSYVIFGLKPDSAVIRVGTGLGQTLAGGDFNDKLSGLDGDDSLYGNGGADTLEGGAGDDRLFGGEGQDLASYQHAAAAVSVDLAAGTASGGDGVDALIGIEGVTGGAFADTLSGDDKDNRLEGGEGDDTLAGGGGVDTLSFAGATGAVTASLATGAASGTGSDSFSGFENLVGGAFADSLTGDSGDNLVEGGGGDDTLDGGLGVDVASYATATAAVTVDFGAGTASGGAGADSLTGFENLVGSRFKDALTGDANANAIDAGVGNDTVEGGDGDDNLIGGAGIDTLSYAHAAGAMTADLALGAASGAAGADIFTGFENLTGGGFGDVLAGNDGVNRIDGGGGDDTVSGGGGKDVLIGGDGADTVDYSDATAKVTVNLQKGRASGGEGADTLSGFEKVVGGAFNDVLTGSDGADTLAGGGGGDVLTGGKGNDIFLFTSVADSPSAKLADLIADLSETDSIDLSAIDADTHTDGDQAFRLVAHFSHKAGELVLSFDSASKTTMIQGDIDGDGRADLVIKAAGDQHAFDHFVL